MSIFGGGHQNGLGRVNGQGNDPEDQKLQKGLRMANQRLGQGGKASDLILFFQRGEGSPLSTPKVTGVTAYLPALQLQKVAGPYEAQIGFFNLPVAAGTPIEVIVVSPEGQTIKTTRLTRNRGEYVIGENYIHFAGLGDTPGSAGSTGIPWIPLAAGAGMLGLILFNSKLFKGSDEDDGDEDEEEDDTDDDDGDDDDADGDQAGMEDSDDDEINEDDETDAGEPGEEE